MRKLWPITALLLGFTDCAHSPHVAKTATDHVVYIENEGGFSSSFCAGVAISEFEIATAAHCIKEGVKPKVTTFGGGECKASTATVDKDNDAAILRVRGCNLNPARVSRHRLKRGDTLYVVGHPLGETWSVSAGILSRFDDDDFIQTDAAINPGNSGGGVFDDHGHLVGIVSYLKTASPYPVSAGLGFATPIRNCLRLR